MKTPALALAAALLIVTPALLSAQDPPVFSQDPRAERERQFEELMNGARLIGQFTALGSTGTTPAQPDSYSISRISRMEDGRWLFTASMSFGDNEVAIPMPFEVMWAGDTPVITLTEQTIPGLGTFTARVLIYDGLYAGTWRHGTFGGHLWGRIAKAADESETLDELSTGLQGENLAQPNP